MENVKILAVKAKIINEKFRDSRFYPTVYKHIASDLEGAFWGNRSILEKDESCRQIIPYNVLFNEYGVVVYERSDKGGEKRLHGSLSIGIGGHIETQDEVCGCCGLDVRQTIDKASARELAEEIQQLEIVDSCMLGVLVDHSNEVGRVHLGVVTYSRIKNIELSSLDSAVKKIQIMTPNELKEKHSLLEPWSRLISPLVRFKHTWSYPPLDYPPFD